MISVIIPLYNKGLSIGDTINTVIAQTFTDFEIIVVDDGSADNGADIVESMCNNRVRLIKKNNGGVSSARNEGIRNANGEYIAFLDADDRWEPTYLEEQARMIEDFPDAAMWGTGYGTMTGNEKKDNSPKIYPGYRGYISQYFERGLYLFCTDTVVIKKHIFEKIGYFDERINCGEDLDMWFRIILQYPIAYLDKTLAYYRQDSENRITTAKHNLKKHFTYYIDNFKKERKENIAFRKYYEHEVLMRLFEFYERDRWNPEIWAILRKIDFSIQPKSYLLRYLSPRLYKIIKRYK